MKKFICIGSLFLFSFFALSSTALAKSKMVFAGGTNVKKCYPDAYFKAGEESKKKHLINDKFPYGSNVCFRAYTDENISSDIAINDEWNGKFLKGMVKTFNYPDSKTGFWDVAGAIGYGKKLPVGRHCVRLTKRVSKTSRKVIAMGCFSIY